MLQDEEWEPDEETVYMQYVKTLTNLGVNNATKYTIREIKPTYERVYPKEPQHPPYDVFQQ